MKEIIQLAEMFDQLSQNSQTGFWGVSESYSKEYSTQVHLSNARLSAMFPDETHAFISLNNDAYKYGVIQNGILYMSLYKHRR